MDLNKLDKLSLKTLNSFKCHTACGNIRRRMNLRLMHRIESCLLYDSSLLSVCFWISIGPVVAEL